jgi:hypothetical protein
VLFYTPVREGQPAGVSDLRQPPSFLPIRSLMLAVLLGAAAVGVGSAAQLGNLYEATAELDPSKSRARDMAFAEAMEIVLVRVTGQRNIASDPGVGELLAEPGAFVTQFRETIEGELWVAFDGRAVNRVLTDARLPIWGEERPVVLALVAMDVGGGERYVLAAEDEVPDPRRLGLRESLVEQAERRGLPVVLPLMDAQDRSVLSFTDVWGGYEEVIMQAAARYGVEAVLLGRYRYDEPDRMRWTLLENAQADRWIGQYEDGVDGASDRLAQRYAVATDAALEGEVGLAVSGVGDYGAFRRVLRFLEGLTAVERVSVRALEEDEVVFGLQLRGNLDNVDQAIRLGGFLTPDEIRTEPGPTPVAGDDQRRVALAYRLAP